MRILVVTTSYPRGDDDPAGHFVASDVRELTRAGHEVHVIGGQGDAFGWPGVVARIRERPVRALSFAKWVHQARREILERAARTDLIVAHWAIPSAWPIAASRKGRLEIVSHGADVRLLCRMPEAIRVRLIRHFVRADSWRFVSASLADDLARALPNALRRDLERIAVVRPSAFEMIEIDERARKRRADFGSERLFVTVGRLIASKRVEQVIDYVSRETGSLVVVGDGPERTRLEAHAELRGVQARFVGLVPRSEALAWIGAADVLLHASDAEGCATVLREARTLGTNVLDLKAEQVRDRW